MDNKLSFKELIQLNIDRYGYHVTIVGGGVHPRFAYSIGLYSILKFEMIFAGGAIYLKDELLQIFNTVVSELKVNNNALSQKISINGLGEFTFSLVHHSWSRMMLLGTFDYYKDINDIQVYQIIPGYQHFTYDIPDMSKQWDESTEPVWQWLKRKWNYNVPENSTVVTNIDALQGEPITELMRWELDEWEMFAGSGPDVEKKDMRVVSLGTMLGIDNTLLPAIDLEVGKGLWRTDKESEWEKWG